MAASDPIVVANVLVCTSIVIRLMYFRKPGARHNRLAAYVAWFVILGYAPVPFGYLFGIYCSTSLATLLANIIVCIVIFKVRGNMARIISAPRFQ